MSAPTQGLWHNISHWPSFSLRIGHEPVAEPQTPDTNAFRMRDCDDCGPTAEALQAGSEIARTNSEVEATTSGGLAESAA
jgi:hypothetical protein